MLLKQHYYAFCLLRSIELCDLNCKIKITTPNLDGLIYIGTLLRNLVQGYKSAARRIPDLVILLFLHIIIRAVNFEYSPVAWGQYD
jgi:hypothetical protein